MYTIDKFSKKVLLYKNKDIYIVFYSKSCPFCVKAIDLLKDKDLAYKKYNLDKIRGGLQRVLEELSKNKDRTEFDPDHKTKPIIFHKGKFVGGYTELANSLDVSL